MINRLHFSRLTIPLATAVIVLLGGCAGKRMSVKDPAAIDLSREVVYQHIQAFSHRDLETIMATIDPDAQINFPGDPPDSYVGGEADIRASFKAKFEQSQVVSLEFIALSFGIGEGVIWFEAQIDARTGQGEVWTTNIYDWNGTIRGRDGKWRIYRARYQAPPEE